MVPILEMSWPAQKWSKCSSEKEFPECIKTHLLPIVQFLKGSFGLSNIFWDTLNRVGDCCIMTLQSGHQLSDSHCSVKHESNNIKFVQWPNICRGLYLSAATFNPLLLWEKLGTPSGLTLGLRHLLASCIWPQESGQENCSNSLRPRRMKWPRKINQESSFDWNTDHKWQGLSAANLLRNGA